jgi:hypothetical protein
MGGPAQLEIIFDSVYNGSRLHEESRPSSRALFALSLPHKEQCCQLWHFADRWKDRKDSTPRRIEEGLNPLTRDGQINRNEALERLEKEGDIPTQAIAEAMDKLGLSFSTLQATLRDYRSAH